MATKMTQREMAEYRNFHDTSRREPGALALGPTQREGLMAELRARVCSAEQGVADAAKYRPRYAPAGKPTRTEQNAKVGLREAVDLERFLATVLGLAE